MKTQVGKRIQKSLLSSLLLFLLLFVAQASAYAGTVRGVLLRRDGSGNQYAAPYIKVSLNNEERGRSALAYSGTDGMYYLYNVPAGDYLLEIWLTPTKPLRYKISVSDQPYTDIAQIFIP
jgi:hypothetical protein